MGSSRRDKDQTDHSAGSLPAADLPEQPCDEVQLDYSPAAPKGRAERKIHPRQPAPAVPEGADVPDLDPSPPLNIEQPKRP